MPRLKLGKLKRNKEPVSDAQQPTISALFGESSTNKKQSPKSNERNNDGLSPTKKQKCSEAETSSSNQIHYTISSRTLQRIQNFSAHSDGKEQTEYNLSSKASVFGTSQLNLPDSAFVAENENHSSSRGINNCPRKNNTLKYTPLEQQVLDLKQKHSGMILMIQTGYKYTFFGEDAEIASRILNIVLSQHRSLCTAVIPVIRLHAHIRRLVEHGYKVGIVNQTETAAMKAEGENKNTPFARELVNIYTKATLIGDDVDPLSDKGDFIQGESVAKYIMCLYESSGCSKNQQKNSNLAFVAFDPSTGETVYDSFEDGSCREELERRLQHLNPAEIITSSSLSDRTECILKFSSARLERLTDDVFNFSSAFLHVSSFFCEQDSSESGDRNMGSLYDFPPSTLVCLSVLIRHLKQFGLHKAMKHEGFRNFTSDSKYLQMDASVLRNLEIFNTSSGSYKGSLMWALNHTKTKFGSRLLHEWLSQPLGEMGAIQSRQEAITELRNSDSGFVCQLRELLTGMPDIDRGLTTCLHQRCGPATFYAILQSLVKLHADFQNAWSSKEGELTSPLLQCLIKETIKLLSYVQQFLQNINEKAARDGDETQLLNDYSDFPSVVERLDEISEVNGKLDSLKPKYARLLGLLKFDYVTVSDQKFLIEVKHNQKINVPSQWRKISETKQAVRYRSSEIDALAKELSRLQEKLVVECHSAWLAFLDDFNIHYFSHKKAVRNVATLDVLSSLAHVATQDGFCKPSVIYSDETIIDIENGRHPVTPLLFSSDDQFVPNNTNLQSNSQRCMILSGPNMGGKSCYIRQVALLAVMAHIGSYIPADSATISLLDSIFTRMGARDNLFKGRSTFMMELEEVSTILHKASCRSLVLMDELGRGTSSCDGTAIAIAVLHSLLKEIKCLTLFVTHYPAVMEMEQQYSGMAKNYHMAFLVHDKDESPEILTFLYKVTSGPTSHSYGLNVARLAGIPPQILKKASEKSGALEMCANSKRCLWQQFRNIWSSCQIKDSLINISLLQ